MTASQSMPERPDAGPTRFVLVASPDVADSIGRDGFLAGRLQGSRPDAPTPHVAMLPGVRCDVFAQQLAAAGTVPEIDVPEGLEPWFASMFSAVALDEDAALVALSISDGLVGDVRRHPDGFRVQPPSGYRRTWTEEQHTWLDTTFASDVGGLGDLEAALREIAAHADPLAAELLIFNVSTYTPTEKVYRFEPDAPEPQALRAQRLNLLLDRLAAELDLYLLDVDRIIAELGAADTVVAPARYTDAALDVVADEAASTIANLPGVSLAFGADAMQLTVPRFDRRTQQGELLAWHITAPAHIAQGDQLFDVRFDNLQTRLDGRAQRTSERSLQLSVVATQDGYLSEITKPAGADVTVGTMVGVVVKDESIEPSDVSKAGSFPVGVKMAGRRAEEEED